MSGHTENPSSVNEGFSPDGLLQDIQKDENKVGAFKVLTANDWMEIAKKQPNPVQLFGEFWFLNEVTILFSDTNTGKSVLAVQIAQSLATGDTIPGFPNEAGPMDVLYLDFELSEKQFETRYSEDYMGHFRFGERFHRVTLDPDVEYNDSKGFEELLMSSLEQVVLKCNAKAVIIDNLTYIKNETDKAKDAAPLMRKLKEIKTKYDISILVLAHTPKLSEYREISLNDVTGSKALMNFADSAFAIGKSRVSPKTRYIKQIKVRSAEHRYGSTNVMVCELEKVKNFLQFTFKDFSDEQEHLAQRKDEDRLEIINKVQEMKASGMSNVAIGKELEIAESTVRKYLAIAKEET